MKRRELDFILKQNSWFVDYEINYFGTEIKIVTSDINRANEWCLKKLPIGIKWNLKLKGKK